MFKKYKFISEKKIEKLKYSQPGVLHNKVIDAVPPKHENFIPIVTTREEVYYQFMVKGVSAVDYRVNGNRFIATNMFELESFLSNL